MKKALALLMTVALFACSFAACQQNETPDPTPAQQDQNNGQSNEQQGQPENSAQPRPYAFSGKSVRNAARGFFCRNEGFPRIFPMECNLLWLKMFGSLFRAGTCCRRAVCISSEKSVSLSEEPASEGGRLIALGGLLPAGRILPAKR
mgnify:CR=1 FL=1